MNISAVERCLHDRGQLAFAVAAAAGLPGKFRAFQSDGLLVLLTTSPGLDFLNSVSGITERSLDAVPDVLTTFASAGAPPPVLTSVEPAQMINEQLHGLGFTPSGTRPTAVIDLPAHNNRSWPGNTGQLRVSQANTDDELPLFLDILAAGYAAATQLSAFMRLEHSTTALRRFLAWRGDEPVAAAAMSLHGEVAVLGGAATLPTARGCGAQLALLHHRLHQAAEAGCTAATATAAPDSPSLRNLTRVGFTVTPRASWRTNPGRLSGDQ